MNYQNRLSLSTILGLCTLYGGIELSCLALLVIFDDEKLTLSFQNVLSVSFLALSLLICASALGIMFRFIRARKLLSVGAHLLIGVILTMTIRDGLSALDESVIVIAVVLIPLAILLLAINNHHVINLLEEECANRRSRNK